MPYKEVYDHCHECGEPKSSTHSKLCRSCAAKKWWAVGDRRDRKRKAMNKFWSDPQNREAAAKHSRRIWSWQKRRDKQRDVQIEVWSDPRRREKKSQEVSRLWEDEDFREHMERIYQSEEYRDKLSNIITEQWKDQDIRAAHMDTMLSEEYREKQRVITTERYKEPEQRLKTGISSKRAWARPGMRDKHFNGRTYKWSTDWLDDYPDGFDDDLKENIRRRDDYECVLCGMSQEDHGKKLFVHHIDYDKDNCEPENLASLCNSCHSKTNWNRPYWEKLFDTKMDKQ